MSTNPADPPAEPVLQPAGPLHVASLSRRRSHGFAIRPDAALRAALADELGARALRKVALTGTLTPTGRDDWRLDALLGATAVQDCVVTGAPVTTRIETPVLRHFVSGLDQPVATEMEIPEDDSTEPLGSRIDLHAVLTEALSLALPDYPRAADAPEPEAEPEAPEGAAADEDARPNPFAVLARLKTGGADDTGSKD